MKRLGPVARRRAGWLLAIAVAAFVAAVWLAHDPRVTDVDRSAKSVVRYGRARALETPMTLVSIAGSGDVLVPITLVVSLALWRRGHRALALSLPAVAVVTALTLALTKWLIARPRPTLRGYGFPSGHVFGATVFVLLAVYLLWRFDASALRQRAAWAVGIAFVTLVGYSRIYVNAHWLSDVVGGLLAGIALGLAAVLVLDARVGGAAR